MQNKKILWSSLLAIVGILSTATVSIAETNHDSGGTATGQTNVPIDNLNGSGIPTVTQFDPNTGLLTGGIIDAPVQITTGSSSGSGGGSGSGAGLGSSSGSGGGSGSGAGLGSSSGSGGGSGSGAGLGSSSDSGGGSGAGDGRNTALGKGECVTIACLSSKDTPQKITLKDASQLLENNLDTSADTLAAAEEESRIASNTRRNTLDENARRIVRNINSCPNPDALTAEAGKDKVASVIEAREVLQKQVAESQKFLEQVNLIDPEKNIW